MKNTILLLFALLLVLSFQSNNNISTYTETNKQADARRVAGSNIFLDKTYKDTYKRNSEARAAYQKGVVFTQDYLKDANLHLMKLRLQHNIGLTYSEQKNYDVALDYFTNINKDLSTYKDKLDSMSLYTLLKFINTLETARTYTMMGELEVAKLFFEEADIIALKNPSQIPEARLLRLYTNFAGLLRRKELYGQAEEIAHKGLVLMDKSIDSLGKADLYMNLANTMHDSKRYSQAEDFFLKALALYKDKNTSDAIRCIKNLGESYRKNHKLKAANKVLSEQINALNKADTNKIYDLGDIIGLYINRGETRYDAKRYKEAYLDYQKALEWLQFKPNTEGVLPPIDSFNGNRFDLLMVLNDIALVHIQQNEEPKALAVYDTVSQLINLIRRDYVGEEDKMNVSGKTRGIMEKAVNVCIALYTKYGDKKYVEQAFNFSEQSKAMTLLENAKLKWTADLSDATKEQLSKIKYDISTLEQKIATDPNNAAYITELRRLNTEKRALWQKAKTTVRYNTDNLATISQVQKNLSDDQALVEYFIEKEDAHRLHTFVILKNAPIQHHVETVNSSFEQHIDSMATYLSQSNMGHQTDYCRHAHALYKILIEPVKNSLPKRLIIIPEYPLSKIPFAALVTQPNLTTYKAVVEAKAFLGIFDKAITYNYSANLHDYMMQNGGNKAKTPEKVAMVAPSFGFTIKDRLAATLPDTIALNPIPEQFNEKEAVVISDSLKAKNYLNVAATKDHLMAALRDNTVVHISTHGILMNNPKLSFISMTQAKPHLDTSQVVFLSDLYNQSLGHLNLVFLSACETGISKTENYKGEGMLSMSWGLASAGVKSFVTTLWSVNAQSTSELTPLFYKSMAKDASTPKDVALTEAQETYLSEHPEKANPYFWAGFVLVGNTEGLVFEKPSMYSPLGSGAAALAGGFIALLGWFFYKRRKKK